MRNFNIWRRAAAQQILNRNPPVAEWIQDSIDAGNETNCAVQITKAEVGANYECTISGGTGADIVRTGTVTAPTGSFSITGLDCSVFDNGTVLSSYREHRGAIWTRPVTDTIQKNPSCIGYDYCLYAEPTTGTIVGYDTAQGKGAIQPQTLEGVNIYRLSANYDNNVAVLSCGEDGLAQIGTETTIYGSFDGFGTIDFTWDGGATRYQVTDQAFADFLQANAYESIGTELSITQL